jgi:hypothetical protein
MQPPCGSYLGSKRRSLAAQRGARSKEMPKLLGRFLVHNEISGLASSFKGKEHRLTDDESHKEA